MFIKKENWKKSLLKLRNHTIKDAIYSLNKSGVQIIIVVNKNNKLIGTITDGDIRRALVRGEKLESNIKKIINTSPLFLFDSENLNYPKKISNFSLLFPIVNKKMIVSGLCYFLKENSNKIENSLLIMAGGKGTRLKELTKHVPKTMLPYRNKPILEHIILNAKKQGIKNFIISINYLGKQIKKHFGNGSKLNVKIEYIEEKFPMGTAGSLSLVSNYNQLPLIIINGDVITDVDFSNLLNFHKLSRSNVTIGVISYDLEIPYGVIDVKNDNFISIKEKPYVKNFINSGVYVFDSKLLNKIKSNKSLDMDILLSQFKKKKLKIKIFPIHEKWIDIGLPKDYENLTNDK